MTETPPRPADDEDEPRRAEDDGPDTADLDEDPAYEPDDEGLKRLKGG